MLLFHLTTRVNLLPMQGIQSLSKILKLSVTIDWRTTVLTLACVCGFYICSSLLLGNLDVLESLKSMIISVGLYFPPLSSLIPSISFVALRTRMLLMYTSRRC